MVPDLPGTKSSVPFSPTKNGFPPDTDPPPALGVIPPIIAPIPVFIAPPKVSANGSVMAFLNVNLIIS
tara:strand:- start:347 stop:550 length:204 start_codon:yes stop_codon:yes gene_type:complete